MSTAAEAASFTVKDTTAYGPTPPASTKLVLKHWADDVDRELVLTPTQQTALQGTGLTLTPALFGLTTEAFADGIWEVNAFSTDNSGSLKVLISEAAKKCIMLRIAKLSKCTSCDDHEMTRLSMLADWKDAALAKYQFVDYQGAHDLITAVNTLCSPNDCSTC